MAFYRQFIRFNFIGAIIILAIYLILNDINDLNKKFSKVRKVYELPFPNGLEIKKIDVSQGDDIWILSSDERVKYKFNFC